MSRAISRFELTLVVGVFALAAFVGVLVLASGQNSAGRRGPRLSKADSVQIATQYQNQISTRDPVYTPSTPDWLKRVHIARLQSAEVAFRDTSGGPRISSDSINAVLRAAGGSYIESMLAEDSGSLYRWRGGDQPIRVWVEPYSSQPGFSSDLVSPTRRGFTAWNDLDLGVQFVLADDSTQADVHVLWSRVMARSEQIGVTFRITSSDGWIVLAQVIVSTARDIYTVQNAVRHEAGHVLGLGHSPNMQDIMASATEGRQYQITDADARTARLLYTLPPGTLRR